MSRDRGAGYGEATARALPHAIQVADRWHLMDNASAAFLDAVRLSMRAVRNVLGSTTIDPALLTAAERLQHEGFLRREDTTRQILALKEAGHSIKEIVRRTRHSRRLVGQAVRGIPGDVFRIRQSSLEAYLPVLLAEWEAGCRSGAELWRRLKNQGFKGCSRVVAEWTARRRRADLMQIQGMQKAPSARTLARLMTMARDHLTRADTVTVAAVETGVPRLADARRLVEQFGAMVRTKAIDALENWIEHAKNSLIAPLARGVAKDVAAIRAAITEPWSNGQTEGQINRLKMIKRQMYGRAKLDLLEARLIGAHKPPTAAKLRQSPFSTPNHNVGGTFRNQASAVLFVRKNKLLVRCERVHDVRRAFGLLDRVQHRLRVGGDRHGLRLLVDAVF